MNHNHYPSRTLATPSCNSLVWFGTTLSKTFLPGILGWGMVIEELDGIHEGVDWWFHDGPADHRGEPCHCCLNPAVPSTNQN